VTRKHPIDFDAYVRGDTVAADVIRDAAIADGVDVDDPNELRYYQMGLRDQLKRHLFHRYGVAVSVIARGTGALHILRDGDEQHEYCQARLASLRRQMRTAAREQFSVDRNLLTSEQQRQLDREIEVNSRIQQMLRNRNKRLPPVDGGEEN
jgi:hypothetical protein